MRLLVALLCAACGGSGASDLTPDTPEPDGPECEDSDGNGVCDFDLCPDVPGTDLVDPDGDGFGWSCDPVESFATGHAGFITAAIAHDTFGAVIGSCPSGTCNLTVVVANSRGSAVATGTDPTDSWMAGRVVRGPFIAAGGRTFFSRGEGSDVGEFNPVDRSFTSLAVGDVDRVIKRGDEAVAMIVRTSPGNLAMDLLEPQANGGLLRLATSMDGFLTTNFTSAAFPLQGSSALIPVLTGSGTYDLTKFTIGAGALEATSVTGADRLNVVENNGIDGYLSTKQSAFVYSELTSAGLVSGLVPFPFADNVELRGARLLRGSNQDASLRGAAIVRDGGVIPVFGGENRVVNEFGGESSIFMIGRDEQASNRVWELAPDNTVRVIADGLLNAHASAEGTVVHVLGVRPTGNGRGNQVLIRSRPATAPQEIVLKADVEISVLTDLPVITTVEGGAIAGSIFETFLVSSTSSTPVRLAGVLHPKGGVRGEHTVLTATAGSGNAVYVYGETGGSPTLTELATSQGPIDLDFLDPPVSMPRSDWFKLFDSSCSFARIEVVGGVRQLARFPAGICPSEIAGALADGTLVTRGSIWLLRADGPVHIADNAEVVTDPVSSTPLIVGWTGVDELGGFTCMASDPDRCWGVPGTPFNTSAVVSTGAASTDSVASVWFNFDELRFYVVRSIGAGDRPRP